MRTVPPGRESGHAPGVVARESLLMNSAVPGLMPRHRTTPSHQVRLRAHQKEAMAATVLGLTPRPGQLAQGGLRVTV